MTNGAFTEILLSILAILLAIVPILALYPLILKFFTKGTMSGALKG